MADSAPPDPTGLTHLDAQGRAQMVDVSHKAATARVAIAAATLRLSPAVRDRLCRGELPKGEALAVARVAGIQAAKATATLIPLCHPLPLAQVSVQFEAVGQDRITVRAEVRTTGPTGVEMEALTAASIAALTLYDMSKALCREAVVETVQLLHKSGGKSGTFDRSADSPGEGAA